MSLERRRETVKNFERRSLKSLDREIESLPLSFEFQRVRLSSVSGVSGVRLSERSQGDRREFAERRSAGRCDL